MNELVVAIVIPVYNAGQYLADTIKSVKNQSYSHWILILVDDCSTDNSRAIIEKAKTQDTRIQSVFLPKNGGVALARNAGIDISENADYLAFLDADDIWLPNRLERQLDLAKNNKETPLFYSGYEFADAKATPMGVRVRVPSVMTLRYAYRNHLIWTSTVLINLGVVTLDDVKMLDIDFGEDVTTWWRILSKYGPALGIDEPLAVYRRSGRSLSSNKFLVLHKKWLVFSYADLRMIEKVYYYFMSLYNAAKKRI